MADSLKHNTATIRYPALLALGLLLFVWGRAGAYTLNDHSIDLHHPPGQRVDIGGYSLHIYCLGEGSPTIVFDSGIGGFSLEWARVQTALAQNSRVCTYDRAGYGWSDRSPYPRTTNVIVGELHRLLTRAAVPGPYVLVGHSFGGYNVRYFASEFPGEVDGLVLIDASHPEQFGYFPRPHESGADKPLPRHSSVTHVVRSTYPSHYPAEIRHLAYMLMVRRRSAEVQLAELEHFQESARQVLARSGRLRDIPVTVLTRGLRVWPDNNYGDAMERVWSYLQRDFLSLTSRSEQRIARHSGHAIHLDQPALVVDYIRRNLRNARWYAARPNLVIGATGEKERLRLRSGNAGEVTLTGLVNPLYKR